MLDDSRDQDVPARNVKLPLKNPLLSGPYGITHVAVGARHGAALVKTPENNGNRILTWGSNEYGALGRITDERPRFATTRNDDRRYMALPDLDTNPEWKPSTVDVDVVGEELRFSQLACGAETTFALTDTGDVYGWGCFMKKEPLELPEDYELRFENMGVNKLVGFSENVLVQEFLIKLPELKNIRSIAAGDNHVLALDANGKLYVWGSDEQGQLGHRRMARRDKQYLKPALFRQKNTFQLIGTGRNHSFAIQENYRKVWGWGQNDFCQTGTENETGVEWMPAPVPALSALSIDGKLIERITGTDISSIASISDGNTLVWGCLEPNMTGLDPNSLDPAKIIRDPDEQPVILITPTQLKRAAKSPTFPAGGRTHILVRNGRAFSWGKNLLYECGQGHTDDIVKPTRLIAAREGEKRDWVWAGAGHQFGMLASHTRNAQKWEQSRNELRPLASTTDGQAGPAKENDSSSSASGQTRPSGESPASSRDGQAEPSGGNTKPSSVAGRARSSERSSRPTVPGIVGGIRPVPREREGPLRLMSDEEGPEPELHSSSPRLRHLKRPRVVEPVRRLTGPGRPRPIMEVRPGRLMPLDHSERSLGAMTPSPPPDPQRDTGIQWGPLRDDIDELDAAMPGWGPQNRSDNAQSRPAPKRVPAQTSYTLKPPPSVEELQAFRRRRMQPPPQSHPVPKRLPAQISNTLNPPPPAPKRLPAPEESQDIIRARRQPSPQNLVPRGRLPLAPAQLPVAEEPQETSHTQRHLSRQNPEDSLSRQHDSPSLKKRQTAPRERLLLAPARLPVAEETRDVAPRESLPLAPARLPVAEETRDVAPRERLHLAPGRTDPGIVGGIRPVPREREGPLRLMSDEEGPEPELNSSSPRLRHLKRPRVVEPVRRLTGPGRPRPIMEVRPVRRMPPDHSERSLGAMTPSPPPDPQRDTGIQWGPLRDDIDELDAAMPGWVPQNRRDNAQSRPAPKQVPAQTSYTLRPPVGRVNQQVTVL